MNIFPGILEDNQKSLLQKARLFSDATSAQLVQIDICDGVYVPSLTWPYSGDSFNTLPSEEIITTIYELRDAGVVVELDLMIDQPEESLITWLSANPRKVIIHARSSHDLDRVLAILHGYSQDYPKFEYGLAFTLDDEIIRYRQYIKRVHYVQIMGIRQIGFQGQSFDEGIFKMIHQIREFDPEVPVQVDGGVNEQNASLIMDQGVNTAIMGSALFSTDNPRQTRDIIARSLI